MTTLTATTTMTSLTATTTMATTLWAAALLLPACAAPTVRPDAIARIRSVATVNFVARDRLGHGGTAGSPENGGGLWSIALEAATNPASPIVTPPRVYSDAVYDLIVRRLEAAGFAPTARAALLGNAQFVSSYGALSGTPLDRDPGDLVLGSARVNLAALPARATLLDALHVDGLLDVEVSFETARKVSLPVADSGTVERFPQARIRLALYDRASGDPVWSDRALGAVASASVKETQGVPEDRDVTPILVEAAGSALDALLARLDRARASTRAK